MLELKILKGFVWPQFVSFQGYTNGLEELMEQLVAI